MIKKIAIVISIFVLAAVAYFYLSSDKKKVSLWEAVPEDAIAVVELSKVDEWWYDNSEMKALLPLLGSEVVAPIKEMVIVSDSILERSGYKLFDLTGDKTIALLFSQGKNGVASSLLVPESEGDQEFVDALIKGYETKFKKVEVTAGLNGEGIKLDFKGNELFLTKYQGLYVISFSEVALKSIHQQIENKSKQTGVLHKKKLHDDTEVTTENLNVYINPVMLFRSVDPLMKDASKSFLHALEHFADNTFLDVKFDEESIYFNGFTHDSDTAFTFANCLKSQDPIPFTLKSLLPNRTLSFAYLGISDGSLFKHNLEEYSWSSDKPLQDGWSVLHKTFQINVDHVYEQIRGEVVLVEVLNRFKEIDKLVYIKPISIQKAEEQYLNFAKGALDQDEELVTEVYKDLEIVKLGEFDFAGKVFGSYFSGFESTYFARIGDYIVLGESPQPIKALVNDVEDEEVWSRSLEKNFLVERYFADANFGFYVDLNNAIDWLDSNLSKEGKKSLSHLNGLLSNIGMFTIQITNENEKLFTSMISVMEDGHADVVEEQDESNNDELDVKYELFFEMPIASKPIVVRNHVDRSLEVVVIDSLNKMFLVSNAGEVLWEYQLDGPLTSKLNQVDVYKNGKLQYLFSTENKVYCVDRKGNDVENYPYEVDFGTRKIGQLSVVDYDGSKDYRVAASTTDGYLQLANIKGEVLGGWDPKKLQTGLSQPLYHARVRGRDFMLVADQNSIHAFKRNGEYYDGFPVQLDGTISGAWHVHEGPSFRKSFVTVVLDKNRSVDINLNGKQTLNTDFRNVAADPKVSLVTSSGSEQKVFLAQNSPNSWVVNGQDKELFALELEGYSDLSLQYYPLRKDAVFAFRSGLRNQLLLYNQKGKLIGGEVLDGSNDIALIYQSAKEQVQVYTVNRRALKVVNLPLK